MITELVIDRARWGTHALKNSDGTMCCLGFLSEACGYGGKLRHVDPYGVDCGIGLPRPEWVNVPETFRGGWPAGRWLDHGATHAATINDSCLLSWADKESELISLFGKNGIKLSFTGLPKVDV